MECSCYKRQGAGDPRNTVSLWVCMYYEHMLLRYTYYLSVPLNAPQILL